MKVNQLMEILQGLDIVFLNGKCGEISVEPQIKVVFDKDFTNSSAKASGYVLSYGGKIKKVKPEKLLKKLEKLQAINGDGVNLSGIGDDKISYEKYLSDKEFSKIDMKGLLEKYSYADKFSLTCPFNCYGEHGRVYCKLSEQLAASAADEVKRICFDAARSQYDALNEKEKAELPPFEELYKEIAEEYRKFYEERRDFAEAHDDNVFFCDEFVNSKYADFVQIWHVYHEVDFEATCLRQIAKMQKSTFEKQLDGEIAGDEILKNNLLEIKVSYGWHCTVSGELSKTFYFKLNEQTKEWLLKHKNDYDFETLQDLAFYSKNELLFSSCTHEGFHCDYTEKRVKEV